MAGDMALATKQPPSPDGTGITQVDPTLKPYAAQFHARYAHYRSALARIDATGGLLGQISQGHHYFGLNRGERDRKEGVWYREWAPAARSLRLIGDFNNWDGHYHQMRALGSSGVWEIFIPGVGEGAHYKFEVRDHNGHIRMKADPCEFFMEVPPKQASIVWNNKKFKWTDDAWLKKRKKTNPLQAPVSTYELHIGSWRKKSKAESFGYRELAAPLIEYLKQMGFTHV